ncbi:hypothetical protein JF55_23480 [Pseudomonas sp. 1-7]|nr:hypothetical protein JF55_23480 [Pseudomonas sp. 1-7]
MPAPLLTRCTLLCSLLLPLSGVAAELYRYVDDKGVTVLSRQGVPRRGIYDNMKTAVDKVNKGKGRAVNARFAVMHGCMWQVFNS